MLESGEDGESERVCYRARRRVMQSFQQGWCQCRQGELAEISFGGGAYGTCWTVCGR